MQPTALDSASSSWTVHLDALPFPVTLAEMGQPVAAVVGALDAELREIARSDERVRAGRIFSTRERSDGSVSLDVGWRAGCTVSVLRKAKAPAELTIKVHVLARLTRWLQWGAFVVLLVAAPILGKLLLPLKGDAGEFLGLLLAGCLLGVGAILLIGKMRPGTDRPRSEEMATRARGAVAAWVERVGAASAAGVDPWGARGPMTVRTDPRGSAPPR